MNPADLAAAHRAERAGRADAIRATVGVILAYGAAVLLAGLVTLLLTSPALDQPRSAGATRAQIAMQAAVFLAAAMLLIEGLRLGSRPGARDLLAEAALDYRRREGRGDIGLGVLVGILTLAAALLVGPMVSAIAPALQDPAQTVDQLGLGTGLSSDLGTVIVVAGLVALAEELLFRGVLVGAWQRAGQPLIGIALSTLLFGLAHATVGQRSVVIAALLGLLLAVAYVVTRSLVAPVLAHACLNGLALIDGGITAESALVVMVAVVLGVTLVADRLSRVVSAPPHPGRLGA